MKQNPILLIWCQGIAPSLLKSCSCGGGGDCGCGCADVDVDSGYRIGKVGTRTLKRVFSPPGYLWSRMVNAGYRDEPVRRMCN